MPRLRLGLLARRANERARARSELTRARDLFASEDGSRLSLFGGGFSRQSLTVLCQRELERLEGTR